MRAGPVFGVLPHCVEKKRKRETEVRQSGGGARRGGLCGGFLEMSCGRAVVRVVFWWWQLGLFRNAIWIFLS